MCFIVKAVTSGRKDDSTPLIMSIPMYAMMDLGEFSCDTLLQVVKR